MLKEFLRTGVLLTTLGCGSDKPGNVVIPFQKTVAVRIADVIDNPPEKSSRKPLNLMVVGDVSASFSRESRPDIMKKLEQLFDVVRPGRDFLQVYVLGIPTQPNVGRNNFGREEVEIVDVTETPIHEDALLDARAATCERYYINRGQHSDNLWILRRIHENFAKGEIKKRRDVLVFFWDGEPNSWDDVDWARYPDLTRLPFPERIAQYQKMIETELLRLKERGIEIYFVAPKGATLPDHARSAASAVFTSDGDRERFTAFVGSLRFQSAEKSFVLPRQTSEPWRREALPRDTLAKFQAAQRRDRDLIMLSVLSSLLFAGLGFALRRQKRIHEDAVIKIQNVVQRAYEDGFEAGRQSVHEVTSIALEFRAESEAELRRVAEKQIHILTEKVLALEKAQLRNRLRETVAAPPELFLLRCLAPTPTKNSLPTTLAAADPPPLDPPPPAALPAAADQPDPPSPAISASEHGEFYHAALDELQNVIEALEQELEQGREREPTPSLDRAAEFEELSLEKEGEIKILTLLFRLLQACENRGHTLYFFGPDDYHTFFEVMEEIYGFPIDRTKPFQNLMNPALLQIELAKRHNEKSQKLKRLLAVFLLVHGDRLISSCETIISLAPTCFTRCAIQDISKKTLLVLEWDTDHLEMFDIPYGSQERFFSPRTHDDYTPESCRNMFKVAKKILEKII